MTEKEIVNHLKNIDWQHLVKRNQTCLMISLNDNNYPYLHRTTGFKFPHKYVFRDFEGEIMLERHAMDKTAEFFAKASLQRITAFKDRLVFYLNRLDKLAKQLDSTDVSVLTDKQLLGLLEKFGKYELKASCFLNPLPVLDRILTQRLLAGLQAVVAEKKQEVLGILTYPFKENSHVEEERGFLNLVIKRKTKEFLKLLAKHLKEFQWIGSRGFWFGLAWDEKFLMDRIKSFVEQKRTLNKN